MFHVTFSFYNEQLAFESVRLLAKYIHKTVHTDTDRARYDWLLSMIKYWWVKK